MVEACMHVCTLPPVAYYISELHDMTGDVPGHSAPIPRWRGFSNFWNKANTLLFVINTGPTLGVEYLTSDDCFTDILAPVVSLPLQASKRIFFVEPALSQYRRLGVSPFNSLCT
jgi:hypothetical protein